MTAAAAHRTRLISSTYRMWPSLAPCDASRSDRTVSGIFPAITRSFRQISASVIDYCQMMDAWPQCSDCSMSQQLRLADQRVANKLLTRVMRYSRCRTRCGAPESSNRPVPLVGFNCLPDAGAWIEELLKRFLPNSRRRIDWLFTKLKRTKRPA